MNDFEKLQEDRKKEELQWSLQKTQENNEKKNYKIEGYWRTQYNELDSLYKNYPFPVENSVDKNIKDHFVNKLEMIEEYLKQEEKYNKIIQYKGSSFCRLCKKINGSIEYVDEWRWPKVIFIM